jgi:aspartyl protease family protein
MANSAEISPDIVIKALFTNKVFISINGHSHILRAGESNQGLKLIEADSESAILEYAGVQQRYYLDKRISNVAAQEPETLRVLLSPDSQGMYFTRIFINDSPVDVLIDTGASVVAMNLQTAKRLNIDISKSPRGTAMTANGPVSTYHVRLKSVKLGKIHLKNIEASVLNGKYPEKVLLGMSFLKRLSLSRQNNQILELTQKR